MDAFDKAQKLFKEYEKNGVAKSLEEAIEILDGILKNKAQIRREQQISRVLSASI